MSPLNNDWPMSRINLGARKRQRGALAQRKVEENHAFPQPPVTGPWMIHVTDQLWRRTRQRGASAQRKAKQNHTSAQPPVTGPWMVHVTDQLRTG